MPDKRTIPKNNNNDYMSLSPTFPDLFVSQTFEKIITTFFIFLTRVVKIVFLIPTRDNERRSVQ